MLSNTRRPEPNEVPLAYHQGLIGKLTGDCVLEILTDQLFWMCELSGALSSDQVDKIHAPYGWTVRQVIEHCVDAERIFGDRMLRIAAGDKTNQHAWDENAYAAAKFGLGNVNHLITELAHLRQANVTLLRRINATAWNQIGTVDSNPTTVRAIAWISAGHLHHHFEIIEQRCDVRVKRTADAEA